MQLPGVNYDWQVQDLAERDIYAPQKVSGAKAGAAGAWAGAAGAHAGAAGQEANAARAMGRVYEQVGGYVNKAMMQIQQESFESEAQTAYVNSLNQLNELENKLYTSDALNMEDPLMEGVNYDDSYEVVDGENIETLNKGYAPTHTVGHEVWATKSQAIVNNFTNGMSKGAQKIYGGRIRDQIMSKTQNMGRHVLKLGVADQQSRVDFSIDESNRIGDATGAIRIAEEAHSRGIIDRKKADDYILNAQRQNDLLRFNQELSVTKGGMALSKLSGVALFSDNYMTTAQKVQSSNAALTKIAQQKQEARQMLGDWRDNNEMNAIIGHYKGEMGTADLVDNKNQFGRANFTRLFDRMQKPVPQVSDPLVAESFGRDIINAPFDSADPEQAYRELDIQMANAVKRGDFSPDDYEKAKRMMENQAKAPFARQPYSETKKALFVDILGTIDPATMEEIQGAGVNVSTIMLKKMGQSENASVLAIQAFKDLNEYVRANGSQADPVGWWKENQNNYKTDKAESAAIQSFSNRYSNDTIMLGNGKVDIKGTEDNLARNFRRGVYGDPNSTEALLKFSERAAALRGKNLSESM